MKDSRSLFAPNPNFTKQRREANQRILNLLDGYLQSNPDIRFGQALINLGIVHSDAALFYIEPQDTLATVEAKSRNPK